MEILIFFKVVVLGIAIYALFGMLPFLIIYLIVSMGSFKYIIYLDKQLAKDLTEYYLPNGKIRPWLYETTVFTIIGQRFLKYCLAYPFIRYRVTTKSKVFRVFMWAMSFWVWCIIAGSISMFIDKILISTLLPTR